MTSCRNCGTTITATDTYCAYCGANVQAQSAPPPRITEADAKRIAKANVDEVGNTIWIGLFGILALAAWYIVLGTIAILAGIELEGVEWTLLIISVALTIASMVWIMNKVERFTRK